MAGEPLITPLGCLTLHDSDSMEQKQKIREIHVVHLSEGDLFSIVLAKNVVYYIEKIGVRQNYGESFTL